MKMSLWHSVLRSSRWSPRRFPWSLCWCFACIPTGNVGGLRRDFDELNLFIEEQSRKPCRHSMALSPCPQALTRPSRPALLAEAEKENPSLLVAEVPYQHNTTVTPRSLRSSTQIFCIGDIWQATVVTGPCVACWSACRMSLQTSYRYSFYALLCTSMLACFPVFSAASVSPNDLTYIQATARIYPKNGMHSETTGSSSYSIMFSVSSHWTVYQILSKSIQTFTAMSFCHVGGMLPWLNKFEAFRSIHEFVAPRSGRAAKAGEPCHGKNMKHTRSFQIDSQESKLVTDSYSTYLHKSCTYMHDHARTKTTYHYSISHVGTARIC